MSKYADKPEVSDTSKYTDELYDQLLGKISSKYQTNSILLGFTATMLAVVIAPISGQNDIRLSTVISMFLMLFSVFLFLFGLWSFDRLTMPKAFWSRKPLWQVEQDLRDVHGSDLQDLSSAMIDYWNHITVPGLVALVLGVVLFLSYPLLGPVTVNVKFIPPIILGASVIPTIFFAAFHTRLQTKYPEFMQHLD